MAPTQPNCLIGTSGKALVAMCAAVAVMRLVEHDGHRPRPLREWATKNSWWHEGHWILENPCSKIPHRRVCERDVASQGRQALAPRRVESVEALTIFQHLHAGRRLSAHPTKSSERDIQALGGG